MTKDLKPDVITKIINQRHNQLIESLTILG
jgi:hypothetical protein